MFQLIHEDTNLVSNIVHFRQPMQVKGIAIQITGTNGATACTLADVGKAILKNRNNEIVNCDFEYLMSLNHQMGGNPRDNSAISGALDFMVYIPLNFDDKNVVTMLPKDQYQLTLDHNANMATRIASGGKVRVFADVSYGISGYIPTIRQYAYSASANGKVIETIRTQNIFGVLIGDTVSSELTLSGCNISTVQCNVGDFTSRLDLDSLIGASNYKARVEVDYDISAFSFIADGDITQRFADSVDLYIDIGSGGASTPQILVLGALFDGERAQDTKIAQVDRIKTIQSNKLNMKDSKTANAINLLQVE